MRENYQQWHKEKAAIEHCDAARVFFHEREVWWCSLGSNVGFEQDGKGEKFARPILVFKKFNKEICWALPLSTKVKQGKFYSPLYLEDGLLRVAIISQLRLTDAKRFIRKIGVISEINYQEIQKAVINLCDS